ncbi:sugar transporter [Wallemia mellicola]|uniref:Sugar transporter n=2 Tax=Wallemia mellicola TaxID=1708541 RepID=A0A4T0NC82_9BASI|nr:sugar transporter [Wallemia mellicola CBS 633.66]TIB72234.1 hypothetical protein E3Q24_01781 [Wallemia mellicola]EIM23001.1 sugar transporter [Wallemia mellicola CBS 633.66]TIB81875.1 sugar transporter [Wallemia mellicola]TIB86124.1 sugar transporter [Wallemia mellicola]TIB89279.1 sugar transporter [Wallemia mellicola]|eukprot:XP_006957040.1 sugar transporter [Wallemia mellicola CBS 633.66]
MKLFKGEKDVQKEEAHLENPVDDAVIEAEQAENIQAAKGNSSLRGIFDNPYVSFVATTATLGGFLFGYDQGVVSNVLALESFKNDFRATLDPDTKGVFVASLLIAAIFGALAGGPLADCKYIGRKWLISGSLVLFVIGAVFQTAAQSMDWLYAGRVIAGLAIGALTECVPVYISEVTPANLRGSLVCVQQLSITFGILVSFWISYGTSFIGGMYCNPELGEQGLYTGEPDAGQKDPSFNPPQDLPADGICRQSDASWIIPFAIQIGPAIVLWIALFFMPKSPRFLLSVGKEDEARATLARLRRRDPHDQVVNAEVIEVKAEVMFNERVKEQYAHKGSISRAFEPYKALLRPGNRKRLFCGAYTMFSQQFIGVNAIIYYAPTVLGQAGLQGNSTTMIGTGVYGVVNFVATIPVVLIVDKIGRRPLLIIGAAGCLISHIIVASLLAGYDDSLPKDAGYAAVVFIFIFCVMSAISFSPIGWLLPSEAFPLSLRSTGVSVTTAITWTSNMIIGLATPSMFDGMTSYGTFYFFAGWSGLALLFALFILPETKGLTLEQMDQAFPGANNAVYEKEMMAQVYQELGYEAHLEK